MPSTDAIPRSQPVSAASLLLSLSSSSSPPPPLPLPRSLLLPDVLARARVRVPAPAEPLAIAESCIVRAGFACVGGFAMGAFFGAAMAGLGGGAMAEITPVGRDVGAVQALREGLSHMRSRALSSGKSFAVIGGIYSLVECPIERARGKRDTKNAVITGAITGAAVAWRAGPKAMALGALGFAAFGVAMDTLFPNLLDGFGG